MQYWLQLGKDNGLEGRVVVREGSHFIDWGHSQGLEVMVNPMPWPDRFQPWKSGWQALKVARWGKRMGADFIHCNEHDIYPFVGVLKKFLKRPTVCHVRYKLSRGYAEWAFKGNKAPDVLLWTSHQQKHDSADAIEGIIPEDRQHVLSLGVDLETFGRDENAGREFRAKWNIQEDEILIGIPSPLRPRKRIEDFVELMRRVGQRHENVVGLIAGGEIAGDEDYRKQIERQIADSGLGRRLRWVGYLEPVEPFHQACDISVSTSEYETFGNSVCEAMACGKPVAGYVGGSVAEVVGETGLIVETGDLDGLTGAVDRLIEDAELRNRLGHEAKQRVATTFNPAQSLKQLKDIYQSLLASKN